MPHLVSYPDDIADRSIAACLHELRAAHAYLSDRGAAALKEGAAIPADASWGSQVKRRKVMLDQKPRPALLQDAADAHSLIEVMNQCATMERMMDALTWAQTAFEHWTVAACHPTTSSVVTDQDLNHDIVLRSPDGQSLAQFEVSDVASSNDGNKKQDKDLQSLGWLVAGKAHERVPANLPKHRCFLVVSREFAPRLRPRTWTHFAYGTPLHQGETTTIIEIINPKPRGSG